MATSGSRSGGVKTGGRVAGTPNQLTVDVKEMILGALNAVGGVNYLIFQARKNPVAFMALLGKLLPTQVTGKDGGAIVLDPGSLTDAELAARINELRRITTAVVTAEAEDDHLPE